MPDDTTAPVTAEDLARLFHDTYESLAPDHGYETRQDSAVPWENVPAANKSLMIAVAGRVLAALAGDPGDLPAQDVERHLERRIAAQQATIGRQSDELERLRAELARLHQGEADHPGEPGTWPTPAQWIRRWNDMTPEHRLEIAGGAVEGMQAAAVCRYQPGHEGQIAQLQAERDALKAAIGQVRADAIEQRRATGVTKDPWALGVYAQACRTLRIFNAAMDAPETTSDAPTEETHV